MDFRGPSGIDTNGNNAAKTLAGEKGPVDTYQDLKPFVRYGLDASHSKWSCVPFDGELTSRHSSPSIDPIFGSTEESFYGSSTTGTVDPCTSPGFAWVVFFLDGGVDKRTNNFNNLGMFVRSVRGGR
jgi:hypothetical protein